MDRESIIKSWGFIYFGLHIQMVLPGYWLSSHTLSIAMVSYGHMCCLSSLSRSVLHACQPCYMPREADPNELRTRIFVFLLLILQKYIKDAARNKRQRCHIPIFPVAPCQVSVDRLTTELNTSQGPSPHSNSLGIWVISLSSGFYLITGFHS